jgi:hypothetical protein
MASGADICHNSPLWFTAIARSNFVLTAWSQGITIPPVAVRVSTTPSEIADAPIAVKTTCTRTSDSKTGKISASRFTDVMVCTTTKTVRWMGRVVQRAASGPMGARTQDVADTAGSSWSDMG